MKIAIASDHGGYELKEEIKAHFLGEISFEDLGVCDGESCDYPDIAKSMAENILSNKHKLGILICGTGIGISIAANRHNGIRAALIYDRFSANASKEHNDANIMVFGGRTMKKEDVFDYIKIFLDSKFMGDRHIKRIEKMDI